MSYFEKFKLSNILGNLINPATEETAMLTKNAVVASAQSVDSQTALLTSMDTSINLLKRIAKLLEPMGTQDVGTRQRITVDAFVPTANANITGGTITSVNNLVSLGGVDYRYTIMDQAHTAYILGIRSKLSFS